MSKLTTPLAIILTIIAIFGGITLGLCIFTYGIWSIVLMVKGTLAVSFFSVLKIVASWILAIPIGWIWCLSFIYLAKKVTD